MNADAKTAAQNQAVEQLRAKQNTKRPKLPKLLQLPGLVAISLYMFLLSCVTVVYVMKRHVGPLYLVFSVLFIAGGLGLLKLLRWAWALTLAAVALLAGSFLWGYSIQHSFPSLMQGLLNLMFFLYLVRTDVREKLK